MFPAAYLIQQILQEKRTVEEIVSSFLLESEQATAAFDLLRQTIHGSEWEGRVYAAGGYVRDQVMGKDAKDLDVVVDGGITAGIDCATWVARQLDIYKKGSNPIVYPKFGTAKIDLSGLTHNGVDLNGTDIEFVAPRVETYTTGSRKPEVASGTLKQDVLRRDLTINSLLQNLTTQEIHDLTGLGIQDIKAGVIRTPIDADQIFKDDPLRILRAFRFAFKYQFDMPLSLVRSIRKNAESLHSISSERIRDEFNKILVVATPSKALRLMKLTGVLDVILPEIADLAGLEQNKYHKDDVFKHTMSVLDNTPPKLMTRLAALFHDVGKKATRTQKADGSYQFIGHEKAGSAVVAEVMRRLKYPKTDIDLVSKIVSRHMDLKHSGRNAIDLKDKHLRKFVHRIADALEPALEVIHADNISHADAHSMPNQIDAVRERLSGWDLGKYIKPKLPVTGRDIVALGAQGKLVGEIMDRLIQKYLEHDGIDRELALEIARSMIQSSGRSR